jgi:hypothetical protein
MSLGRGGPSISLPWPLGLMAFDDSQFTFVALTSVNRLSLSALVHPVPLKPFLA